jgi:hypothetical protein
MVWLYLRCCERGITIVECFMPQSSYAQQEQCDVIRMWFHRCNVYYAKSWMYKKEPLFFGSYYCISITYIKPCHVDHVANEIFKQWNVNSVYCIELCNLYHLSNRRRHSVVVLLQRNIFDVTNSRHRFRR